MKENQFHQNYWQGKTQKQIEDSTKFAAIGFIGFIAVLFILAAINLL